MLKKGERRYEKGTRMGENKILVFISRFSVATKLLDSVRDFNVMENMNEENCVAVLDTLKHFNLVLGGSTALPVTEAKVGLDKMTAKQFGETMENALGVARDLADKTRDLADKTGDLVDKTRDLVDKTRDLADKSLQNVDDIKKLFHDYVDHHVKKEEKEDAATKKGTKRKRRKDGDTKNIDEIVAKEVAKERKKFEGMLEEAVAKHFEKYKEEEQKK